jgi:hypothetical protein
VARVSRVSTQKNMTGRVGSVRVISWVGFKTQPHIKWADPYPEPILTLNGLTRGSAQSRTGPVQ